MAYEGFTKNTIFADANVNTICNNIVEKVTNKFTGVTPAIKFAITGTVAKILQGDTDEPIKVIPFITDNQDVYDYCAKELAIQLKATAIKFTDRIQIKIKNIYFEVWFTNSIGTINIADGIDVQATADIPANIN